MIANSKLYASLKFIMARYFRGNNQGIIFIWLLAKFLTFSS